jgi:hypothetical protein
MAIIEDRLSTQVVQSPWIYPDDANRQLDEDYEIGPIALEDTSEGLQYQSWYLSYDSVAGEFTVTPETVGSPQVVLTGVFNATQCSLAFDNNGHVNIAYSLLNGQTALYWYDTLIAGWTTTTLPSAVFCPTLTLDDKRYFSTSANDILLWWTEEQPDSTYKLYRAQQRDRFDPLFPKEMAADIYPYIYKCGMNEGLRVQLGLSDRIL